MQRGFLALSLPVAAVVLIIVGVVIWFKILPFSNKTSVKPDEITRKYIWEWKSPNGNKNLKLFNDGGFTFFENDKKGEIYPDIKQLSSSMGTDSVRWSPDERYAVLFSSPLKGIYCVEAKFCDSKSNFGAKVFNEIRGIYWVDNNNAVVVYLSRPDVQISKLTFNSNTAYPLENKLTKIPYDDKFRVIPDPVTSSPNGRYIIFESGYEFADSPQVLNTLTGKFSTIGDGKKPYILSPKPGYKWQGSVLEFEGGPEINGSVEAYQNGTKSYELIKVDLPAQGY